MTKTMGAIAMTLTLSVLPARAELQIIREYRVGNTTTVSIMNTGPEDEYYAGYTVVGNTPAMGIPEGIIEVCQVVDIHGLNINREVTLSRWYPNSKMLDTAPALSDSSDWMYRIQAPADSNGSYDKNQWVQGIGDIPDFTLPCEAKERPSFGSVRELFK